MKLWPLVVFVGIVTLMLGPVLYQYRRYLVELAAPSRTLMALRTLSAFVCGIAIDEIYRNTVQLHEPVSDLVIALMLLVIAATYTRQFYERHRAMEDHKEYGRNVR